MGYKNRVWEMGYEFPYSSPHPAEPPCLFGCVIAILLIQIGYALFGAWRHGRVTSRGRLSRRFVWVDRKLTSVPFPIC
jgi:hypothetical protein